MKLVMASPPIGPDMKRKDKPIQQDIIRSSRGVRCWRAVARSLAVIYAWDPYWGPLVEALNVDIVTPVTVDSFGPSTLSLQMSIFLINLCGYAGFKKHDRSLWIKRVMHFPLK